MKLGRKLVSNTVLLFGGDQLGNLLQIALLLYVAGKFGEAPIGRYGYTLAAVGAFALIGDLGVVEYTIREVARRADRSRAMVARALVLRSLGLLVATGIGLLCAPLLVAGRDPDTATLLLLLGGYQLSVSIADVLLAELKGLQLMGRVASVGVAARTVTLLVGGSLALGGAGFTTIFSAFTIAGVSYLALAITFSVRTLGPPPLSLVRLRDLRALLPLLVPFGSAILFNEALSRQDMILMGRLGTEEGTGIYWAALKIATLFLGVSGFFQHAIYPMLSELHAVSPERLEGICRKVMRYLLIVAFPISAGIFAISDRLIDLLFRGKFSGSTACLQVMSWVVVIGLAHSVFSALLSAVGRQHQKAICLAINLSLGICLNLALIPAFGPVGASSARLAVELAPLLMYGWLARLALPGWNPFPDALRPALASAVMILAVRTLAIAPLPVAIAGGAAVYTGALLLCGGFGREDREVVRSLIASYRRGGGASPETARSIS